MSGKSLIVDFSGEIVIIEVREVEAVGVAVQPFAGIIEK